MISCRFENNNQASLRHAVVDVLVLKDNDVLLVKRTKKLLEGGKWALVGGYMERDESLQETVMREVFEETGYRVDNITLLTIRHNPDRPNEDRQNISFVFFCDAREKEGKPDWENDEVKWFALNELPNQEMIAFDHQLNIDLYRKYQKEKFQLPIFN